MTISPINVRKCHENVTGKDVMTFSLISVRKYHEKVIGKMS